MQISLNLASFSQIEGKNELPFNKVFNEDCFISMARMGDSEVDVVFTSPPYNRKRNDKYAHYDDRIGDYYGFLCRLLRESQRIAKRNVFINIQKNYYNKAEVFKFLGEFNSVISELFIWEKSNPLPASGKSITNSYEFVIAFGDTLKSNNTYTKNHLTTSVAKMPDDHKAVMHEDVARFFIKNFTNRGDVVYDPFMGTGTTAKICGEYGVACVGSEISKEYYDKYKLGSHMDNNDP